MRKTRVLLLGLAVVVAAQLVPVHRTNPPVEEDVDAPADVKAILRRACYDCHSNETVWGWHTYVAPISWLVTSDVREGREELNFSRWNAVTDRRLARLREKLPDEVREDDMPPLLYRLAHRSARLTDAERAAVIAWGRSLGRDGRSGAARDAGGVAGAATRHDEDEGEGEGGGRHRGRDSD